MAENKGRGLVGILVGFPGSILKFIKEAREELKKVSWPDRQTTINYTIVVVVASLVVGLVAGGADYLLAQILKLVI